MDVSVMFTICADDQGRSAGCEVRLVRDAKTGDINHCQSMADQAMRENSGIKSGDVWGAAICFQAKRHDQMLKATEKFLRNMGYAVNVVEQ